MSQNDEKWFLHELEYDDSHDDRQHVKHNEKHNVKHSQTGWQAIQLPILQKDKQILSVF